MAQIPKLSLSGSAARSLLLGGAAVGGVVLFARHGLYNVDGGHRAVIFNRLTGLGDRVFAEGTHFKFPWLERPIIYDIRTRPRQLRSLTGSRDLQMVNITIRVLSKPDPNQLAQMYRTLGTDYDERVLPSIVNEVVKAVVAQFNASQLITQREQVSRMVRRNLVDRARDFNILLDDVSITELSFSPEYTAAVEAKQVAQQDAERARYIVDKAIQDKKSTVIRAQGEAKAAELVGQAVKENPGFLELRRMEAARRIARTVARGANKLYLSADSLMLNLTETKGLEMKRAA